MRTFSIVWLGQLVSLVGSSVTSFALGVWVYQLTGSATQFSLIAVCAVLPTILLAPLAGVLIDRYDRRRIMLLSDSGAALGTLSLLLLLLAGELELWHIYLLTTLSATFNGLQWPAYNAAITLLVPARQLGRANGMVLAGRAVAQLAAPLLGALLLQTVDLLGVVVIDLLTFCCALLSLLSVRFPHQPATRRDGEKQQSLWAEALYSWIYLKARRGLLDLLVFFALANFIAGILQVLVTPLVLSFATATALATVLSVGGLGMLAGSVALSVWGGPRRAVNGVFGFMALCGLCALAAGLQASVWLIAVSACGFFFALPFINGCTQTIFQRKVDAAVQGRVFALNGAVASAAMPLAYLLAGPLADYLFEPLLLADGPLSASLGVPLGVGPGRGIGLLFIVLGIAILALTLIAYRRPQLRGLEDELPDAPRVGAPTPALATRG